TLWQSIGPDCPVGWAVDAASRVLNSPCSRCTRPSTVSTLVSQVAIRPPHSLSRPAHTRRGRLLAYGSRARAIEVAGIERHTAPEERPEMRRIGGIGFPSSACVCFLSSWWWRKFLGLGTVVLALLTVSPPAGAMQLASGSYTGNGAA